MATAKERKATERRRRKDGGLKRREWWLTDAQAEKVKRFIERLVKRGTRS